MQINAKDGEVLVTFDDPEDCLRLANTEEVKDLLDRLFEACHDAKIEWPEWYY